MKNRIILANSDQSRLESSINHRARYQSANRPSGNAKRDHVKIIMVYEGLAGLARANQIWLRIASRLDGRMPIETCAWNFALLRGVRLGEQAGLQAAAANIVVIASENRNEIPEHVTTWIETWLSD